LTLVDCDKIIPAVVKHPASVEQTEWISSSVPSSSVSLLLLLQFSDVTDLFIHPHCLIFSLFLTMYHHTEYNKYIIKYT